MPCTNEIVRNSSFLALRNANNFENILSLSKNINSIDQKENILTRQKSFFEINNHIDRFKFNIFEYFIYGNCFRVYYKKQIGLYEYGLEVIKNQLDIINVFNANFFFNILFKRLRKIKSFDEDD